MTYVFCLPRNYSSVFNFVKMATGRGAGGVLDCCGVAAKYIIFFFNFLILIGGVLLIVLGVVALVNEDLARFKEFDPTLYKSSAIIFLAAGSIIFVLSFLGCCGAIQESKCMLMTYAVFIVIVFFVVLAAAIVAVVFKGEAKEIVENVMEDFLKRYDSDDKDKPETRVWDTIQRYGKCCGINGFDDWIKNLKLVPQSCCKEDGCSTLLPTSIYREGCLTKYIGNVETFSGTIGYIGLVFAAILLIAIILSFCVACSV